MHFNRTERINTFCHTFNGQPCCVRMCNVYAFWMCVYLYTVHCIHSALGTILNISIYWNINWILNVTANWKNQIYSIRLSVWKCRKYLNEGKIFPNAKFQFKLKQKRKGDILDPNLVTIFKPTPSTQCQRKFAVDINYAW